MREFYHSADQHAITPIQKEIRDFCKDRQFDERTIFEYELLSEELLLKLIEAAGSEDKIRLKFKRVLGGTRITLSCGGKPIKLDPLNEDLGAKIIADYQDRIELIHRHQINFIDIQTNTSSNALSKQNLMAFVLAVCCSVFLNLCLNSAQKEWWVTEILDPFINFFIKLIQNLATPVAFISFLAFIINTNGFLHFDRQSKKTSLKFLSTSVIAILITFFVFGIAVIFLSYLKILDLQLILTTDPTGIKGFFGLSLGEILSNSLPNNILEIFTLANPIPMLMTAIILGWGINAFSNQNNMRIRNGINAVMDLTCRLINKIFNLTPAFLFIAVVDIGLFQSYMGTFSVTLSAFAVGFLLVLIAFLAQFMVYILELIISGCSPIRFFKKYKDMLAENFRIASNFDAKPCNIRLFRRKLKDPSKETSVRNLLDIGANMNMDGNCIIISAAIFMFQLMSGSAINIFTLIELMLIILLLGVGSPNQPGSFTIAMLVLLKFLNLSADFFPALIVLEALFCKLYSSTNAIGDIVTVAIFADDDLKYQSSRIRKGNGC